MSVATRALHAEWTKARTVRSSAWLLVGITAMYRGGGSELAHAVKIKIRGIADRTTASIVVLARNVFKSPRV